MLTSESAAGSHRLTDEAPRARPVRSAPGRVAAGVLGAVVLLATSAAAPAQSGQVARGAQVDAARVSSSGLRPGEHALLRANFNQLRTGAVTPAGFKRALRADVGPATLADTSVTRVGGRHRKVLTTRLQAGTIVSQPAGRTHGIVAVASLGRTVDNACLSYDVRFDRGFAWSLGGKLPGLSGVAPGVSPTLPAGGHPAGSLGWSGRVMWVGPRAYPWVRHSNMAISYLYTPTQAGAYGDDIRWHRGFTAGVWHTVRECYTMNTPGSANGRLQAWLDGVRRVNRRSVLYRTRADVGIGNLMWSVFRGGDTLAWAAGRDDRIDFDNVLVTTR